MTGTEHRIAAADELAAEGSRVIAQVEGWEVAVFRVDGELHALSNFCIHESGPLCEGQLTGRMNRDDDAGEWRYESEARCIVCPWHGWTFDVTTGVNVDDDTYAVPTYEVEERDGDVFVTV